MNSVRNGAPQLTLSFEAVDRGALPLVGGKAANLGELTRAGLPMPPGFCVTTAAYELVAEGADNALRGTPASPGTVTAEARVILDPTGARLEPGEVLVAPSTDPGWTPLFLTAGGLVMELGGALSHGAVVAREYGIPAVVGVPDATERIVTGEQITVDGSSGMVATKPQSDS